jgi:hypothetical protein
MTERLPFCQFLQTLRGEGRQSGVGVLPKEEKSIKRKSWQGVTVSLSLPPFSLSFLFFRLLAIYGKRPWKFRLLALPELLFLLRPPSSSFSPKLLPQVIVYIGCSQNLFPSVTCAGMGSQPQLLGERGGLALEFWGKKERIRKQEMLLCLQMKGETSI